jgi:hypothetical protein
MRTILLLNYDINLIQKKRTLVLDLDKFRKLYEYFMIARPII